MRLLLFSVLSITAINQKGDLEQIKKELNQALLQVDGVKAAKLVRDVASDKNEKSMLVLIQTLYHFCQDKDNIRSFLSKSFEQKGIVEQDLLLLPHSIDKAKQDQNDNKIDQEDKNYIKEELARLEKLKVDRADQLKLLTDGLKELQDTLFFEMTKYTDDKSVALLLRQFKDEKKWSIKAYLASIIANIEHKDALPALLETLKNNQDAGVTAAVINALREKGTKSEEIFKLINKAASQGYWQVRLATRNYYESIGIQDAVEPLIDMLKNSDGRLTLDILKTLWNLTGENIEMHSAWKGWFNKNKENIKDGTYKPREKNDTDLPVFLSGMPFYSKNVIIMIDKSASMKQEVKGYKTDSELEKKHKFELKGTRRIDIAKYEAKKIIAQLPKNTKFNILCFDDKSHWNPNGTLDSGEYGLKNAALYLERIEPCKGTSTYNALYDAIYSSMDSYGRLVKNGPDTIYLITDGIAENGVIKDTDEIVRFLSEFNKTLQIAIHTVLINDNGRKSYDKSSKFLKELSVRNNGFHEEIKSDKSTDTSEDKDFDSKTYYDYITSFPPTEFSPPSLYKPPTVYTPNFDTPTTFFGVPVWGRSVVFVLDKTGSMKAILKNFIPNPQTAKRFNLPLGSNSKFDVARFELKKILMNLPKGSMFNIVYFDTTYNVMSPTMLMMDQNTLLKAFQFIDGPNASGNTNILDAVKAALGLAYVNGVPKKGLIEEMFVLTDGVPTAGERDTNKILTEIGEMNKNLGIRINTVLINDKTAAQFMKSMARQNHGQYAEVGDK